MMIQCDSMIDGHRCTGDASSVFRSTFATRLICDECRGRYLEAGGHVTEPVLILEVTAAREQLLNRMKNLQAAYDKQRLKQARIVEEGAHLAKFQAWNAVGMTVATALLGWLVGWWTSLAVIMFAMGLASAWATGLRRRLTAYNVELDKKFGYPELTLEGASNE